LTESTGTAVSSGDTKNFVPLWHLIIRPDIRYKMVSPDTYRYLIYRYKTSLIFCKITTGTGSRCVVQNQDTLHWQFSTVFRIRNPDLRSDYFKEIYQYAELGNRYNALPPFSDQRPNRNKCF
jgi:hypothetical protein